MKTQTHKTVRIEVSYTIPNYSAYPVLLTDDCAPGGSGNCDGFDNGPVDECGCPCHDASDLPETTPEVKAWHDRLHDGLITEF